MSSRDQDRDSHDDDRELDAFLRGEDDLAAALRGLEQPAPPPALDGRIRAQAQEALAEPVGAANDANDANAASDEEERALVASPLGRWRAPLAVAATVVIGVSLALQWDGGRQDTAPAALADSEPAASAPQAREPASVPAPVAAPEVLPDALPEATWQQEPAPVEKAMPGPAPGTRQGGATHAAPTQAVRPPPPPPPAPAASPAPAAPAAAPAPASASAPSFHLQHFAAPQSAEGDADGLAVQRRSAPATTHVEVTGSRVTAADERRPREWLAVIGQLLDHKLDDDARTSWASFRREYPDYPVPDALRRRLDGPAAAP
ncbi:hypothetical protein [Massilia sp. TN1-12]|uniref:hypothetical protein n=1 Tax=Massilia paldalensis TaxID=3377675 RepID=UPI00384E30BE